MHTLKILAKRLFHTWAAALLLLATSNADLTAAETHAIQITTAADALLQTLNDQQRRDVQFELDDAQQRMRWSNLPIRMAERRGLRLGDLTAEQRTAVHTLLKATLSKMGYDKVVAIMEGDEVLKEQSRAGSPAFGRDEFFISFMGKPSATTPWMLQFGGHHLALNVTLAGERGVLTPSLIAVQPAKFDWNGQTVRPMGRETDKALALVTSLTAAQRKEAVLGFQMRDLALGPGHDGETIQPEGVKVATFDPNQRKILLELISEWTGIIHQAEGDRKLTEVESHFGDTWFAWSGPTEAAKGYFRIQGPTLVIEFAPQRLGGDVTMHLHSMYRDPTNDYGKQLITK